LICDASIPSPIRRETGLSSKKLTIPVINQQF
jgi:hypothetical protein